MDLLRGDAGNPDGLVPRGLPGEYGDIPARYLQELREEVDALAVCRTFHRGRGEAELEGIPLYSTEFIPRCPRLDMNGKTDAASGHSDG